MPLGTSTNSAGIGGLTLVSTPNLLKIGSRMEQNGSFVSDLDAAQVYEFPEPFKAGTIPYVVVTLSLDDGAGGKAIALINELTTNTHFAVDRLDSTNNTMNPLVKWHAIGEI